MKRKDYLIPDIEEIAWQEAVGICIISTKGAGSISEDDPVDWQWQNA